MHFERSKPPFQIQKPSLKVKTGIEKETRYENTQIMYKKPRRKEIKNKIIPKIPC
jgi:hypothetical protein